MGKIKITLDENGNRVVIIPDIIFINKQGIEWKMVETYLLRYVGEMAAITDTKDIIYIGDEFPNEYSGSRYTRGLKGARAKAKANAAQGIREMLKIAVDKKFCENRKEKHARNAGKGWYYYTTRFAVPVYNNEIRTREFNVYIAKLVVNHAKNGKLFLYDIVDIKKEASTPLKTDLQSNG